MQKNKQVQKSSKEKSLDPLNLFVFFIYLRKNVAYSPADKEN
ncbi:hypothetical protein HMPREF9087_2710 [Enterococcus casseliflavus ATCC 12755]|uniref:Uncharacterized protein n=1 Tax=Enterococcus casseliflavus ATCC 12755 TaxID=888066 RepID=F0EMJ1_ENTCA|nr:hypothetical protein HMPREF9087_2710 [Enterococcus casseliflavus ATCC 12755]EPH60769.1 hypothetical protein D931_03109 [Enterococcus faecium 13.SD.W.09]